LNQYYTDYALLKEKRCKIFEDSYSKIIKKNGLFRDNFGIFKTSPSKKLSSIIHFECDCIKKGLYLNIYKEDLLIKSIKFSPNGALVHNNWISEPEWIDENTLKIFYKKNYNDRDFWVINLNGDIVYHYLYKDFSEYDSNDYYRLGRMYLAGDLLNINIDKGNELINKSVQMNNKHAINWLKYNNRLTNVT